MAWNPFGRKASVPPAKPFVEQGVGASLSYGDQIATNEINPKLIGAERWRTAEDIMKNASIVAAGLRYYLNLLARPSWRIEPADDSPLAQEHADFAESIIHGTDTSWSRLVRRGGAYQFHGFGLHEWAAKRREDGKIGIDKVRPRPVQTICGWVIEGGEIKAVKQRSNHQSGEIIIPRSKLIYFVDDALSDSPEGLGWFRQLAEPWDRMKGYLNLEKVGFDRDLAGTPVGRAPLAAIAQAVKDKAITEAEGAAMTKGLSEFLRLKAKQPDTSLLLDSQNFMSTGPAGEKIVSAAPQWGIELLSASASSIEELGAAINRTSWDMALIMGIERILVGRDGAGSLALSEDTSQNLAMNVNATLGDMAEAKDRDLIGPIWALNGLPAETRPTLKVEDASFKDAAKIARTLADMSAAGAILQMDDPAIDDVRDLLGVSRQPEFDEERMAMISGLSGSNVPDPEPDDPNPKIEEQK